jgi:protein ImuB
MSLAEAQTLAGESRSKRRAIVSEHDPAADLRALTRLAHACHELSPVVATADDTPDAIWLDVTGLTHLYEGEDQLLSAVDARLREWGFASHAALADSFSAAWALARYQAEPSRPIVVPPGETPRAIADLPVESLRLSEQVTGHLWTLGLQRVGQVAALPRRSLAATLEPAVVRRLDDLSAAVPEVLQSVPHEDCWQTSVAWDVPLENAEILGRELERLLTELAQQLTQRSLGATWLKIDLQRPSVEPAVLDVRLFRPSVDARQWLELALLQLERERLPGGVMSVVVTAEQIAPRIHRQKSFIATNPQNDDTQLETLLTRLTSRLGHDAVSSIVPVSETQPERAWRRRTVTTSQRRSTKRPKSRVTWPERPTQLLPGAQRSIAVRLSDDCHPASFDWRGQRFKVSRVWGPERIETGWWRGRHVSRDYYRAETCDGSRAWLYQRTADQRWFLHGWFA